MRKFYIGLLKPCFSKELVKLATPCSINYEDFLAEGLVAPVGFSMVGKQIFWYNQITDEFLYKTLPLLQWTAYGHSQ